MTTPAPRPARKVVSADTSEAVDRFLATLKHPHKDAIQIIRRIMCGADPAIAEGVKWNAPSFRTTEYFATTNLHDSQGIGVILHVGAKAGDQVRFQIEDAKGLIKWMAKDRAVMNFAGVEDVKAHAGAIQAIVREWIRSV